jgi:hypothetical protein
MDLQIQGTFRTLTRHDQKGTSHLIIVKIPRLQNKEIVLKSAREKCQFTYKGKLISYITLVSRNPKSQEPIE